MADTLNYAPWHSPSCKNNSPDDCWVAIHGIVYDLTDFADEHPAGSQSIRELAGTIGTDAFAAVHNKGVLVKFGGCAHWATWRILVSSY